ncbi:MAG: GntR family transcriptional regulator, partial [Aestuariivirga sp.]
MTRAATLPSDADGDAERLSSAERAYRALKDLILGNQLPAGSQLLEQEAAQRLGMSRTPVREAMIRLEQDGVVEIRPRHGMRVLPVSSRDMREIYEVLTALESAAAEI